MASLDTCRRLPAARRIAARRRIAPPSLPCMRLETLILPLAAIVTAIAIYLSSFALVEDGAVAAIIAGLGLVSLAPLALGANAR